MIAYILDENEKIKANKKNDNDEADATAAADKIYIGVSGAAIGNGWVDPFYQYAAAEAAYGHGIIGRAQMAALKDLEKQCQASLNNKRYTDGVCFNLLDNVVGESYGSKSQYKVSQYDVTKIESRRGSRAFPPGHKTVESYLGGSGAAAGMSSATTKAALEAIHATPSREAGQVYAECTDPPYNALSHQDGLGVVNEVVKILEHVTDGEKQVRMLFFNGVNDLICNHVGNEIFLEKLPWKHRDDWIEAKRAGWKSKSSPGDKMSGYMKEYDNLMFLKVMNSGHMVPMDIPEVALDMMRLFMHGGDGAFQYSPQNLNRAMPNSDCPMCPACPTNSSCMNYESANTGCEVTANSKIGGSSNSSTPFFFVGIVLGAIALFGIIFYQRKKYGSRNLVSTYDIEMRGGETYYDDEPDSNGDASTPNSKIT